MSQRTRQIQQHQQRRDRVCIAGMVVVAVAIGTALVAFAAQLGSDEGDGGRGSGGGGGDALVVSMTEFAFDPDPIVVSADNATLEVVNDGKVAHDLVVLALGKGTPDLPAGERMVLDLTGQPAGTYRVVCDLPGHTEAGMVTELTIE